MDDSKKSNAVNAYHNISKHFPNRFADGPMYLDWKSQPEPFRTYEGAELFQLDRRLSFPSLCFDELCMDPVNSEELAGQTISLFFRMSLGLSAWKKVNGHKWALRINPSSGNLHAEEAYLICSNIDEINAGVHHYNSLHHRLERRVIPSASFTRIIDRLGGFCVGLSSIHWREEWKYGERAWRYTQLDIGHAIAAIAFAARMLGWKANVISEIADSDLSKLLGLDRDEDFGPAEREVVDSLVFISDNKTSTIPSYDSIQALVDGVFNGRWLGEANILSQLHEHEWPQIVNIAQAVKKPATSQIRIRAEQTASSSTIGKDVNAWQTISSRRSGQTYDGHTTLSIRQFIEILKSTIPSFNPMPFSVFDWQPFIHPILFVHRVEGLEKGIYALIRRNGVVDVMKDEMKKSLLWEKPVASPEQMEFYLLIRGDFKQASKLVSCHQSIASDGCFSAGMLAEFDYPISLGPWWYRRLFWEAGAVGHALYLTCEVAGIRGTGIGCYFDDSFHELLGLYTTVFQSVYHFTAGGYVDDHKLTTLPPYSDLGD
jgi:SagB-type dehydrogenase family enzyme